MRQKRSKTYRKLLASYILHFGYRPPFQLLIDASFALSLSALHLSSSEASKRLSDVLQTSQLTKGKTKAGVPEMKCMITQCCMVELYQAEKEGQLQKDAVTIAKTWERRKCNHREAIAGDECLKQVIGATNKHRYMLASDSRALRRHLNAEVAGIPLIHTNQSRVIVLEPMSEKTRERVQELEHAKFAGTTPVSETTPKEGTHLESSSSTPAPAPVPAQATRRKPKQANPLSNKKPKKVIEAEKAEKARRTREIAERTEAKRRAREADSATVNANGKRSADEEEGTRGDASGAGEEHQQQLKKRKKGGRVGDDEDEDA